MESNVVRGVPKKILFALIILGRDNSAERLNSNAGRVEANRQVSKTYQLLLKYCDRVFVSAAKEQADDVALNEFPLMYDISMFSDMGNMGRIMSAMSQYPQVDWVVLSADFPKLNEAVITHLLSKRNRKKLATTYQNPVDGHVETLCTVYDAKCLDYFIQLRKNNQTSLEFFLTEFDTEYVTFPERQILTMDGAALEKLRKAKSFLSVTKPLSS